MREALIIDILIKHEHRGRVDWTLAAAEIGWPVHDLRTRYDEGYVPVLETAYTPPGQTIPGIYPIRNHPEGAPLKRRILEILSNGSSSSQTMAEAIGVRDDSVRRRLNFLRLCGLVEHDSRHPRTWKLSQSGKVTAQAIKRPTPGAIIEEWDAA